MPQASCRQTARLFHRCGLGARAANSPLSGEHYARQDCHRRRRDRIDPRRRGRLLFRPCRHWYAGRVITALARRFTESGFPRALTLVFAAAPGDGKNRGLNRVAPQGLVKRAIGGHWSLVPKLARMATDNMSEAYNLPLGTMSRSVSGHRGPQGRQAHSSGIGRLRRSASVGRPLRMAKARMIATVDPIDDEPDHEPDEEP